MSLLHRFRDELPCFFCLRELIRGFSRRKICVRGRSGRRCGGAQVFWSPRTKNVLATEQKVEKIGKILEPFQFSTKNFMQIEEVFQLIFARGIGPGIGNILPTVPTQGSKSFNVPANNVT